MPPLHGAVALAQVDGVLVFVGEHLNLDVARVFKEFFQVQRGVAECGLRLLMRQVHRREQRRLGVHYAHPAPAAAARGLDDHRIADRARYLEDFVVLLGQRPFGAGHTGDARLGHRRLGADLVTHQAYGFRARTDENEAAFLDALGEVGVFGKKTVPGMDGLGIGHLRRADDGRNVEVTGRGLRRADAYRLIGEFDVLRLAVGFGMHHDGLDTQFAAGALDAQGYLAPVGDEDFFKHREV